ncbi:phosphatase PAP2 family protein [Marinilongibacter aquaticus]|uniref:phosphatase PAP2 family protein n=1 Tax=Marinilongibacter aquaticus TaxID=2975157 RepID=UPI0021BD7DCA|nr:phosphatase PAP2 family protein [Marinilongibacter aquaticus]UBM58592.1 phosphatase PAP2 family protein [Marinilongibacter aquaticus]
MRSFILLLLLCPFGLCAQHLDTRLVRHFNTNRNTNFDGFNKGLGHSADAVALATPFALLGVAALQKDTDLKRKSLQAGIAVLGTYGVGFLMKKTIKRDRPFVDHPSIVPVQAKDSYSMPSGSTALAFSAATAWTSAFPKWYVAVPVYSYATAVGFSRIRSGEHYPTDVLAGAVLGTASVWVSGKITRWINK